MDQNEISLLKELFKTRLKDGDNADNHVSKIPCLFESCSQIFDDYVYKSLARGAVGKY